MSQSVTQFHTKFGRNVKVIAAARFNYHKEVVPKLYPKDSQGT